MYYTTARQKNYIYFTDEDNKSYRIDVNTGIFTNCKTEKVIKSFPVGFGKYLDTYRGDDAVVKLMSHIRNHSRDFGISIHGYTLTSVAGYTIASKYLNLVDRAQNVGANFDRYDFDTTVLDMVAENFKDFAKYCQEHADTTCRDYYNIRGKEMLINKYQMVDKYHLSEREIDYLYGQYKYGVERNAKWVKYMNRTLYYMMRGIYDLFEHRTVSYLDEFYDLCEYLGVTPPKDDFARSFINFKREYRMRKKELDILALSRTYNAKRNALTFENDNYIVVIPQSGEDFEAEANEQHNCVFSTYLDMVVKGQTHVVFIRKKDAINQSLVTCEVRNGIIRQYLAKYNQWVTDDALKAFRTAYQAHLTETWNN